MDEGHDGFGMGDLGIKGPKMELEAFGLAKLDVILNLSLRFSATLSNFGIHIIFSFFCYFQGIFIILF